MAGRFGVMDQIFPHELGHVVLRQLTGEWQPGGSNQVHAVAVKTDPTYAFSEGFAEHFQIMAVDDPDADPATLAAAINPETQPSGGCWPYWRLAPGLAPHFTGDKCEPPGGGPS